VGENKKSGRSLAVVVKNRRDIEESTLCGGGTVERSGAKGQKREKKGSVRVIRLGERLEAFKPKRKKRIILTLRNAITRTDPH